MAQCQSVSAFVRLAGGFGEWKVGGLLLGVVSVVKISVGD